MFYCTFSYAMVEVELKNRGEDAFKPEIFGDSIIIERRITESTSTTVLKDHQGWLDVLALLLVLWFDCIVMLNYWCERFVVLNWQGKELPVGSRSFLNW